MRNFLRRLDRTAGLETENRAALRLERVAFVFLVLMALAAPHSIAATQTAWLLGMLAWVARWPLRPRPRFKATALDYALWGFFLWTVLSSLVSYAPDISLDKLRGASLFLIFYFVYGNLRTLRAARFLAGALIFSAMAAVLWTPIERLIGRGVEIYDFRGSAFDQIGLQEGDVILRIDGKKVSSLEEIKSRIFERPNEPRFKALIQRADSLTPVEIPRGRIKDAPTAEASLGVGRWERGRDWRAAGFYGHYTTFAEVMQMIFSLAFGIFVAVAARHRFFAARPREEIEEKESKTENRFSLLLLFCLAGMALALLLTATRASQLAFLISAFLIVVAGGTRKLVLTAAAVALPVALVALVFLYESRRVGFFDAQDSSIGWRQTVYREGFDLWTANARHFFFGVGMDSIKRHAKQWRLFDDGRIPMGHFHSTPLQLLVERGLPALLLWLTVLAIYARTLWRGVRLRIAERSETRNLKSEIETGVLLGCLGGAIGFFTSGLVHYNLGDGEVAMVFYLLMGTSVRICDLRFFTPDSELKANPISRIENNLKSEI